MNCNGSESKGHQDTKKKQKEHQDHPNDGAVKKMFTIQQVTEDVSFSEMDRVSLQGKQATTPAGIEDTAMNDIHWNVFKQFSTVTQRGRYRIEKRISIIFKSEMNRFTHGNIKDPFFL